MTSPTSLYIRQFSDKKLCITNEKVCDDQEACKDQIQFKCEYEHEKIKKNLTITLSLQIKKNENQETLWGVEGDVVLEVAGEKKLHHIAMHFLAHSQSISIGSWNYIFCKEGSYNCADDIEPELLDALCDREVLHIGAWQPALRIDSHYMDYVKPLE